MTWITFIKDSMISICIDKSQPENEEKKETKKEKNKGKDEIINNNKINYHNKEENDEDIEKDM